MNIDAKRFPEFDQYELELNIIERGRNPRTIRCDPIYSYFKPRGVSLSEVEGEVAITLEELEAIRLTDMEGLTQKVAGKKMSISQSTISRHIEKAHRKIAKALVHGFAIRISNPADFFHCDSCNHTWPFPEDLISVKRCVKCGSTDFHPHVHLDYESNSNFFRNKFEDSK
ncbi:MAG: DUF134 domain-containing protein [Candidatus Hodarchaeota archaeon]